MNNDLTLTLTITGDGKVAVSAVTQVENALADAGQEAVSTGQKITSSLSAAEKAAKRFAEQQEKQTARATNLYQNLVAKLTMTTGQYRAHELALRGLNQEQIKHIQLLEKQHAVANKAATFSAGFGGLLALGAMARVAKDILDTNRNMETLRMQLTALTGSAAASAEVFGFIKNFAVNTPFEIDGLTKAYVTLSNFGIKPTAQVMEALTNQAAKLGGSEQTLYDISLALGQAYAKQKLQGQEILQLINAGVPVWDMLSQVTGKNTAELQKMSEKGEIGIDVIDRLIVKMGELSTGSNALAMETLNGKISNLADSWHRFEDALLNDKSETLIKRIVATTTDSLNILAEYFERGNGVFGKIETLNDQIATQRQRIANYNASGNLMHLIGDVTGYDVNLEKNRLDALIKQREQAMASLSQQRAKDFADQQKRAAEKAELQAQINRQSQADASADDAAKRAKTAADNAANEAKRQALELERKYQAMRDAARSADQVFIDTVDEYTHAYNTRNISLEQYIALLAKADDARDKSLAKTDNTLPAIPYFSAGGINKDLYDANNKEINQELDAAAKSAQEYDQWLSKLDDHMKDFGATSRDVFAGALGGMQLLTAALGDLSKQTAYYADKQAENAAKLAEMQKDPEGNADLILRGKQAAMALDKAKTSAELQGMAQVAGATAKLFDEKSKAAKGFHAVEMALSAVNMAMRLKETVANVAAGASAMFAQGGFAGFAGVAAMAAVMAGLGFSMLGGGSSTKRIGSANIPTSPESGTVLGDSNAKSESIANSLTLLNDIGAHQLRELRGINAGVADLSKGITDSVTNLFKGGGLSAMSVDSTAKLTGMGSIAKTMMSVGSAVMTMGLSAIAGFLPGVGDLVNGVFDFVLGGLFGKTTKAVTGGGVYLYPRQISQLLAGGNITGSQYTEITKTTKSWFSKKVKIYEVISGLNAEFTDGMSKVYRSMAESMMALSNEFGQDMSNAVNRYVIPGIKVSLHGQNAEQMAKTLNNVLSTQLDQMTSVIFGDLIERYQKLGEGMYQTAIRLVAEKAVILDALDLTGKTFTGDAIAMADGLIQLAGGIKEFQSKFEDYYSNFYSESERLSNTTRRLTLSLGDMNLQLPTSREGFRALVDAQDLNTTKGREQYNQLLNLATAADTYYAAMEKLRESMKLLSEDTFATAVDYTRYLRLAQLAGIGAASDLLPPDSNRYFMPKPTTVALPGMAPTPQTSAYTTIAASNDAVAAQIQQLRVEMQAANVAIAQNTQDVSKLLKRWDGNGLPATRETA